MYANEEWEGVSSYRYCWYIFKFITIGVEYNIVLSAKGQKAIDTALKADLVILNTAVAGKWLDAVLKEKVPHVLPKVLWWIHEMRGHYFKVEYVKHLPFVAGAMIDSHTTAEYWKNRSRERLSKELMEVAEDSVAKRILHEHVRESLGVPNEDLIFAIINSVSCGKELPGRGECFGRITIEAMTFQLPVSGTAAGGTMEIVVNGTTGLLHRAAKEGLTPLANNIVKLATHVERKGG